MVFDELIRLQYVGTDLRSPFVGLAFAAQILESASCSWAARCASLARKTPAATSRFCACERSCCDAAMMPVGMWINRTADSVLLTY